MEKRGIHFLPPGWSFPTSEKRETAVKGGLICGLYLLKLVMEEILQ